MNSSQFSINFNPVIALLRKRYTISGYFFNPVLFSSFGWKINRFSYIIAKLFLFYFCTRGLWFWSLNVFPLNRSSVWGTGSPTEWLRVLWQWGVRTRYHRHLQLFRWILSGWDPQEAVYVWRKVIVLERLKCHFLPT